MPPRSASSTSTGSANPRRLVVLESSSSSGLDSQHRSATGEGSSEWTSFPRIMKASAVVISSQTKTIQLTTAVPAATAVITPPRPKSRRPPRTTPPSKRWNAATANASSNKSDLQQQQQQQGTRNSRQNNGRSSGLVSLGSHQSNKSKPSSVLISAASPLTRELSDLSGSYAGRTTASAASSRHHHPIGRDVITGVHPNSSQHHGAVTTWTQARILSAREPTHPQPQTTDCGDSVTAWRRQRNSKQLNNNVSSSQSQHYNNVASATTRLVVQAMSVEVIENLDPGKRRLPLIVLLMDPSRKLYELAQMWVDRDEDTVREVLHAIQHHLRDQPHWKQDYDGMFQIRNHTFSQLIHILNLHQYDVQEYELWIAKPWSMSAKATVSYAGTLIHRLKELSVLKQQAAIASGSGNGGASSGRHGSVSGGGESVLVLSKEARSRLYVPDGILKHHHACQYLSFSPPFEQAYGAGNGGGTPVLRVDVLGADSEDGCSQLSDSHYYDGAGASVESSDRAALLSRPSSSTLPSTPSLIKKRGTETSTRTPPPSPLVVTPSTTKSASPVSHRSSQHTTKSTPTLRKSSTSKALDQTTSDGDAMAKSRSFLHAVTMLNCTACKRSDSSGGSTMLYGDTTSVLGDGVHGSPTWSAAWEDPGNMIVVGNGGRMAHHSDAASCTNISVAPSIVSESVPLLKARGTTSTQHGWRYEI